jgi:hypothetical protein
MSKNAILNYQDTGVFAEAEIAAEYLKPIMTTNDLFHVQYPADWPVYFYMWYHNVPQLKEEPNSESQKEYFIIMKSKYSITEMTNKQYITLLDIGNLTLIQTLETNTH